MKRALGSHCGTPRNISTRDAANGYCTFESLISLRIAEHFGGKFVEHSAGPLEKQQRERRIKGGFFNVKFADACVSLSRAWRAIPLQTSAPARQRPAPVQPLAGSSRCPAF